jgi:hypothetical protein
MCGRGTVALGALDVALQLTGDCRGRTPQTVGYLADTLPTGVSDSDLLPLHEGQTTPRKVAPAPRTDSSGLQQPTVMNALEIVDISNNLGDAKSMITHPATTTHRRLGPQARPAVGITSGVLLVSVGLEDVRDLIEDFDRALP